MTSPTSTRTDGSSAAAAVDTTPLADGRFVPFALLGSGSQGQTFEAVDRSTGRLVALKRFDVHGASAWKDVELAEREARVLRNLVHPALPAYVAHFEHEGALYLALEKIEGKSLSQLLAEGHHFDFEQLTRLLETLADVFGYLHGQNPPLVHRDVKPSNILLRNDGRYALIDFGSVRDSLKPQGGSTVVGTFGYMAPEQFQGRALPSSDLYGTGATLLTLLTGKTPDLLPHRGLAIDVRAAVPQTTPASWVALLERLTAIDPEVRNVDLRSLLASLGPAPGAAEPRRAPNEPAPQWLAADSIALPYPFRVILGILGVAIYLLLEVALPLFLRLLAVFFGRSLRDAASDVTRAGQAAQRQLTRLVEQSGSGARSDWWDMPSQPNWEGPYSRNNARRPRKRRIRVGDFDVELPQDATRTPDATRRREGRG